MDDSGYEFDIALSFAGEDRILAESVALALRESGVRVFYDRYEQAQLWGKDLYQHLQRVYRDRARYCVIFVSAHYARKLWTGHELKQAQARAFVENREYILPLRLDDSELPGLNATIGYLDARQHGVPAIRDFILQKLASSALTPPQTPEPATIPEDDEPEFLDLRVQMDDGFQSAMRALVDISELSKKHTEGMLQWKVAADRMVASKVRDAQGAYALVNDRADAFAEQARALSELVAVYRTETGRFFTALNAAINFQIKHGLSTREEMQAGLLTFSKADEGAKAVKATYTRLAATATDLPAPTRDFRKQRNVLVNSIRDFVAAVDYWLQQSADARARVGIDDSSQTDT